MGNFLIENARFVWIIYGVWQFRLSSSIGESCSAALIMLIISSTTCHVICGWKICNSERKSYFNASTLRHHSAVKTLVYDFFSDLPHSLSLSPSRFYLPLIFINMFWLTHFFGTLTWWWVNDVMSSKSLLLFFFIHEEEWQNNSLPLRNIEGIEKDGRD